MIANLTTLLSSYGVNIENFGSRSRGDYAYTIVESMQNVDDRVLEVLENNENITKVRLICKD